MQLLSLIDSYIPSIVAVLSLVNMTLLLHAIIKLKTPDAILKDYEGVDPETDKKLAFLRESYQKLEIKETPLTVAIICIILQIMVVGYTLNGDISVIAVYVSWVMHHETLNAFVNKANGYPYIPYPNTTFLHIVAGALVLLVGIYYVGSFPMLVIVGLKAILSMYIFDIVTNF